MKRIRKGCYEYKGYIIKYNENGYWTVDIKNPKCALDKMVQYQDNTLKDCKQWIDSEVK